MRARKQGAESPALIAGRSLPSRCRVRARAGSAHAAGAGLQQARLHRVARSNLPRPGRTGPPVSALGVEGAHAQRGHPARARARIYTSAPGMRPTHRRARKVRSLDAMRASRSHVPRAGCRTTKEHRNPRAYRRRSSELAGGLPLGLIDSRRRVVAAPRRLRARQHGGSAAASFRARFECSRREHSRRDADRGPLVLQRARANARSDRRSPPSSCDLLLPRRTCLLQPCPRVAGARAP